MIHFFNYIRCLLHFTKFNIYSVILHNTTYNNGCVWCLLYTTIRFVFRKFFFQLFLFRNFWLISRRLFVRSFHWCCILYSLVSTPNSAIVRNRYCCSLCHVLSDETVSVSVIRIETKPTERRVGERYSLCVACVCRLMNGHCSMPNWDWGID